MTGTVSVIIPTYNRARYLAAAVESVLSQHVPPYQVIVVNDGSSDDTERVIAPYLDRIAYIRKENSGKAASVNLALTKATGDYVWVFDDDDVALPHFIDCQIGLLDRDPTLGFTYSNFRFGHDRNGALVAGPVNHMADVPANEILTNLLISCFFRHTAMLVRRSCYEELGGLDTTQERSEDYEFQLRLARLSPGVGVARVTMVFRLHEGARGSARARHEPGERDTIHLAFDRMAFRKVCADFDLADYLPRGDPEGDRVGPPEGRTRREALILKGVAMARRALWPEAVAAFEAAASVTAEAPLSARERAYLAHLFAEPLALAALRPMRTELQAMRRLCGESVLGTDRVSLVRGFYYGWIRDLRAGAWGRVIGNLGLLVFIVRLRGLLAAVTRKVAKRE